MAIFGGMTPEQFAEKLDALAGMKARIAVVTKERRDALDGIRESVATASKKPSCGERLTAAMSKTAATETKTEKANKADADAQDKFLRSKETKKEIESLDADYRKAVDEVARRERRGDTNKDIKDAEKEAEQARIALKKAKEASKINAEHKFPTALTDDILRGISYGELLDTVSGNTGDEGLANPKVIQDTFKEILAANMQDARYILTKEMPEILELAKEHYMESVTDADLSAENV